MCSVLAAAAAIEGKYDWVIVDGNLETDPYQKIKSYLKTGEFKYFGSTVMPGPQLKQAIPFTKLIREKFPQLRIIWGGYFASNHHTTVIKSGCVDVVINGPGDKAFPAVLETLSKNQPLDEIENLVFIRDGKIVKTKKATLYEQDELPRARRCIAAEQGLKPRKASYNDASWSVPSPEYVIISAPSRR